MPSRYLVIFLYLLFAPLQVSAHPAPAPAPAALPQEQPTSPPPNWAFQTAVAGSGPTPVVLPSGQYQSNGSKSNGVEIAVGATLGAVVGLILLLYFGVVAARSSLVNMWTAKADPVGKGSAGQNTVVGNGTAGNGGGAPGGVGAGPNTTTMSGGVGGDGSPGVS